MIFMEELVWNMMRSLLLVLGLLKEDQFLSPEIVLNLSIISNKEVELNQ